MIYLLSFIGRGVIKTRNWEKKTNKIFQNGKKAPGVAKKEKTQKQFFQTLERQNNTIFFYVLKWFLQILLIHIFFSYKKHPELPITNFVTNF